MTTHNPSTPLTVSDILLKNGTARLEDFYPLTEVRTASDKERLLSQGYNPGYTVSEWPYPLGYTGALKAPVRCFGNHLSRKRKSLFRTDDEWGGAAILKNRTSRMGTPVGC